MEKIMEILQGIRPEFDFNSSEDFIEDGYLDSFDLVSLVSELDETFDISIDGLDIIPENFKSLDTITNVVKKTEAMYDYYLERKKNRRDADCIAGK